MGTSSIMEAGNPNAKNMGTRRYPGVVRKGKKCLITDKTARLITRSDTRANISDPIGDEEAMSTSILSVKLLVRPSSDRSIVC